jgi:hypothetical protein
MRYDDPNTPISAVVAVISVVLVVVTILLLEALYFHMDAAEEERKLVETRNEAVDTLRADQGRLLASYGWVDREAGIVHIPVERAAELVIAANAGGN